MVLGKLAQPAMKLEVAQPEMRALHLTPHLMTVIKLRVAIGCAIWALLLLALALVVGIIMLVQKNRSEAQEVFADEDDDEQDLVDDKK